MCNLKFKTNKAKQKRNGLINTENKWQLPEGGRVRRWTKSVKVFKKHKLRVVK